MPKQLSVYECPTCQQLLPRPATPHLPCNISETPFIALWRDYAKIILRLSPEMVHWIIHKPGQED